MAGRVRTRLGRSDPGPQSAPRLPARMRPPQAPAGRRRPWRGVPRPGRRLRRVPRRGGCRLHRPYRRHTAATGHGARPCHGTSGGHGRPPGGPVRQAALGLHRDEGRARTARLPGRRRERLRLHRGGPHPRPPAPRPHLQRLRRHPQSRAGVRHARADGRGRSRRRTAGVRGRITVPRAVRGTRRRDRAGGRARPGRRCAHPRRSVHLARGPAPGLRVRPDEDGRRHRQAVRGLGPSAVDRRAHPAARRSPCRVLRRHQQPDRGEDRPGHRHRRTAPAHRQAGPRARSGPAHPHRADGRRADP